MKKPLLDDCFVPTARRLTHEAALNILKVRMSPIVGSQATPIAQGLGRVLAETITAEADVPGHTNSAVDGYAFAHGAYDQTQGTPFRLAGRAAAGRALEGLPSPGDAVRIFTGAPLPESVDTVAMQEDCTLDGNGPGGSGTVFIPGGLKARANVRRAGEDVPTGQTLFEPGHIIRAQDIAALASVGRSEILTFAPLRIGILSTGDEVMPVGSTLAPGQVYDANAPMLDAMLSATGMRIVRFGIARDDQATLDRTLIDAASKVDVLIATGGASKGEEDHMASAFDRLGTRHLWQLAIKPGRPMSFGHINGTVTVGLPGNPVAVFVCALLYVLPMLQRLGGATWSEPRRYPLPAAFAFKGRKPGRREFWRGILVDTLQGLAVNKFARDGSGLISGLRAADGLIDIPEDHGDVAEGDIVSFIPFSAFGLGR